MADSREPSSSFTSAFFRVPSSVRFRGADAAMNEYRFIALRTSPPAASAMRAVSAALGAAPRLDRAPWIMRFVAGLKRISANAGCSRTDSGTVVRTSCTEARRARQSLASEPAAQSSMSARGTVSDTTSTRAMCGADGIWPFTNCSSVVWKSARVSSCARLGRSSTSTTLRGALGAVPPAVASGSDGYRTARLRNSVKRAAAESRSPAS